jgi:hypothetical protein
MKLSTGTITKRDLTDIKLEMVRRTWCYGAMFVVEYANGIQQSFPVDQILLTTIGRPLSGRIRRRAARRVAEEALAAADEASGFNVAHHPNGGGR